jgi:hypothetical protein
MFEKNAYVLKKMHHADKNTHNLIKMHGKIYR